jgi:hypothetical protein
VKARCIDLIDPALSAAKIAGISVTFQLIEKMMGG